MNPGDGETAYTRSRRAPSTTRPGRNPDQVTDNIQTSYLSGGGARIRVENGVAEYVHLDHQGSPYVATDSAGAVAWNQEYTAIKTLSRLATVLNPRDPIGEIVPRQTKTNLAPSPI